MAPIPTRRDDVTVVALQGDLDFTTREGVKRRALLAIDGRAPNLLIDLSGARTLDSEGLAAFLSIAREIERRGGRLKFCSPPPTLERLFQVSRLDFVFEIHRDREEALASF